ncbi:2-keto-3-deoxygluconate permease [Nesterenkonia sphaerica]|uniref:2-keto-3-deoxygluconate permease n=1 Tax=Nesterenkonia sphaerica TaxID=1804988 RepID=A0A5R9AGE5_9MICC|nr:2-keto-3-deoxygluconate permease [Nesterenkonia sphaerica]TLP77224.1 2-keto-3-deoxygluconate permease [Nesterenkonia sphaerica]
MDTLLRQINRLPGALMIVPLFLGATVNTFFPEILDIGSFTTALFRDGAPVLIGLFFMCIGAQINLRSATPALEKGLALLVGKYMAAVIAGLGVAFFAPEGTLWGLVPLAIIAAMSNSNGSLYVALMGQFGNRTDKGAVSVLSINDGPFLTLIALGVAGLADLPMIALLAAVLPMILGFVLGNLSEIFRDFLRPGEKLIIPFAAFALGSGISFDVLFGSGAIGILLGIATVVFSGGMAIGALVLWNIIRRKPKPTRNFIGGAAEATTAGNAIATPAAVVAVDPSFAAVEGVATAQIAAAVVTTAFLAPFIVAFVRRYQMRNGIDVVAAEDHYLALPKEDRQSMDFNEVGRIHTEEEPDLERPGPATVGRQE